MTKKIELTQEELDSLIRVLDFAEYNAETFMFDEDDTFDEDDIREAFQDVYELYVRLKDYEKECFQERTKAMNINKDELNYEASFIVVDGTVTKAKDPSVRLGSKMDLETFYNEDIDNALYIDTYKRTMNYNNFTGMVKF